MFRLVTVRTDYLVWHSSSTFRHIIRHSKRESNQGYFSPWEGQGYRWRGNSKCLRRSCTSEILKRCLNNTYPSILYNSTAGRYRPVSYPDGPITARYRFMQNAYWANQTYEQTFCAEPKNIFLSERIYKQSTTNDFSKPFNVVHMPLRELISLTTFYGRQLFRFQVCFSAQPPSEKGLLLKKRIHSPSSLKQSTLKREQILSF